MSALPSVPEREQRARRVLVRAVVSPLCLALLSATIAFGCAPATLPLAGITLVGAMALVVLRARDPRFVREASEERVRAEWAQLRQRAERLRSDLDPATAETLDRIVEVCGRLMPLAREAVGVALSAQQVVALMAHCLRLAERRHQIFALLQSSRTGEAERELFELRRQRDDVADDAARALFDEAILHKQAEIDSYRPLQGAIARIDGQLVAARCALEAAVARIHSLRAADTAARTLGDPALAEELARLAANLQALDTSIAETLAVGTHR